MEGNLVYSRGSPRRPAVTTRLLLIHQNKYAGPLLERAVSLHPCKVFSNKASCLFNIVTNLDFIDKILYLSYLYYCKTILFCDCQDMIIEMFMWST